MIVFLVVIETGQSQLLMSWQAKTNRKKSWLHFDQIQKKLNFPKRFFDNIGKKIKDDLF